jgi:hypothetical protein
MATMAKAKVLKKEEKKTFLTILFACGFQQS